MITGTILVNVLTDEQILLDAYSYSGSYCLFGSATYGYSWYSGFFVDLTI